MDRNLLCWISNLLELVVLYSFSSLPFGMEMSILCLSHHSILEADNFCFIFISVDEEDFTSGSVMLRNSPRPDLVDLDNNIWIFLS